MMNAAEQFEESFHWICSLLQRGMAVGGPISEANQDSEAAQRSSS